jgi:alkylated DNA repair dioxygenase AlkB
MTAGQMSLLPLDVPASFRHQEQFITPDEERHLMSAIEGVESSNFEMRGVVARRRVAFFGHTYDTGERLPAPPIPEFLRPGSRPDRRLVGNRRGPIRHGLLNEYPPGAPIGWHRDAPQYEVGAGLSLLTRCRMMPRPYVYRGSRDSEGSRSSPRRRTTHQIVLEPRSVYLLTGRRVRHSSTTFRRSTRGATRSRSGRFAKVSGNQCGSVGV